MKMILIEGDEDLYSLGIFLMGAEATGPQFFFFIYIFSLPLN